MAETGFVALFETNTSGPVALSHASTNGGIWSWNTEVALDAASALAKT
jgi:hypothetical protein